MRFLVFLLALFVALADGGAGLAAKKKKNEPPPQPKAIYEAPMTVVIVRNSDPACEPLCPEWIAAEGEIVDGTPAKFRDVFKRMGKKQLPIIIRSPGGSINAALEIGKMIRKRKLDVVVGSTQFDGCGPNRKDCKLPKENKGIYLGTATGYYGFCNSACPIILASGITRFVGVESLVGVHKPRSESWQVRVKYRETYRMVNGKKKVLKRTVTARKRVNHKVSFEFSKGLRKQLVRYYKEMGVDPAIMDDSEKATNQDMYYFSSDRMDALKLRTSPKSAGTLTGWIVCKREPVAKYCVKGDAPSQNSKQLAALQASLDVQGIKPEDPDMTFTLARAPNDDCADSCPTWIIARGLISSETPERLRTLTKALGKSRYVILLDSQGGELGPAIELSRIIRWSGYDTMIASTAEAECKKADNTCLDIRKAGLAPGVLQKNVQAQCHDACLIAFLGGNERILPSSTKLSFALNASQYSALRGWLPALFTDMGATDSLTGKILALGINQRLPLSIDQARAFNLATWVWGDLSSAFGPDACDRQTAKTLCRP